MTAKHGQVSIPQRLRRAIGGAVVLGLALTAFAGVQFSAAPVPQAAAEEVAAGLPTWDDVQKAKRNQAAAAEKIVEIEGLIARVAAEVEETRRASDEAAAKLKAAEDDLRRVAERLAALEEQAEANAAEAAEAAEHAAALVSQLYRSGGVDPSLDLFLEGDDSTADALLDRLARMEKATERNTAISERAERAMNSAKALSEQTEAAKNERDRLRDEAEVNRIAAAEAADAARSRLIEQESNKVTLEYQLQALKDETTQTVDGYQERLRLEKEEEERLAREAAAAAEAARRAAEEAARKAAEEAAKNNGNSGNNGGNNGGSSGGNSGGNSGVVTGNWTRPLTCCYGVSAEWWGYWGHVGIDLAIGGGTPILAASSGTVTFSGWMDGYGNVVFIDHGNGLQTRYAHMIRTPAVRYGQWVGVGHYIGNVGSTGNSTGDHLHFETLVWGVNQNPRGFMSARGVYF